MVGRDEDVAALSAQLTASHFVTIVGAGGVGKTTVAVAVAHRLSEAFGGATLFVDLGMLSDPRLVTTAIASMLGLPVGSADARPNLMAWLRDKRILLILDTCEHLIEEVAALAASILASAPQVHILGTSREAHAGRGRARLQAGRARRVRRTTKGSARRLSRRFRPCNCSWNAQSPAAPIWISAMRRQPLLPPSAESSTAWPLRSSWRPGASSPMDCSRPPPFSISIWPCRGPGRARRRHDRGRCRQRSTGATGCCPSWNARCCAGSAIFVGHFTLDAALEVVASASLDRSTVLGAIDSLVAKSMVATRPIGAMMRYRLLDTTRAHALEHQTDDTERTETAVRHAAYFRRWLDQFGGDWPTLSTGTERAPHFAALNNVRAALEWCFSAKGNIEIGVGLAAAATPVFLAMSLLAECHRWSQRALLALDDTMRGGSEEMHLQAGLGISSMYTMGSSEQSHAALTRGLELAEKLCDPVEQFRLIGQLHSFHRRAGNFDRMLAVARRGEAVASEMADPIGIRAAQSLLGLSHHLIGNQAEARAHLEAALAPAPASNAAEARRIGFHYERPRLVLARTLWLLGYPEQAVQLARKTIDGFAAVEPVTVPIALRWGGCALFHWRGDLASAKECIERSISEAERHALTPFQAIGYGQKGQVLIEQGEIETGVELLRSSVATLSAERYDMYATELNGSLAQGFAMMGRIDQALLTIDKTIARVERHGDLFMPELQRIRGEILEKTADEQGAEEAFCRSIELADQQSALSWRLRASMSLARLQFRQGRREEAREALAETYARFSEGFDTADLKAAERLLATLS